VQRPRPASHTNFGHRQLCGLNSSIDTGSANVRSSQDKQYRTDCPRSGRHVAVDVVDGGRNVAKYRVDAVFIVTVRMMIHTASRRIPRSLPVHTVSKLRELMSVR